MTNIKVLHELYNLCKEINFTDFHEIIASAESEEEAVFFEAVSNFILQQKQKKVIAEERY